MAEPGSAGIPVDPGATCSIAHARRWRGRADQCILTLYGYA
jgi:hypothetical protein